MKYSFIVPVFNRPDEVDELLESLCAQSVRDFECIVVEDGSSQPCEDVVARYADRLPVRYYRKENGGPGPARNYGAERARGEWLLILDSDIVLPPAYLEEVERELRREDADAFGGPDRAHPSFSPVQKAISYAMTSFLTTGGIRGGGRARLDKFYPRSFNMGVRREVYAALGGFAAMRFGEDIDLSTRILRGGYRCRLFPGAWVWHKRRTDLGKFFKQVHNSGIARIHLALRHPGTLRPVHLLPSLFLLASLTLLLGGLLCPLLWVPLALYALLVLTDSTLRNRSLRVGLLSVPAAFTQLWGYGSGLLRAAVRRYLLRSGEFQAFETNFYE
ncbi:MAG: glycosyltransferase [Alloprevotella sp.]|nr:glycosyltransferase [Alloprevotella sp.]